jgi:FG-GAP repeat protein
MTMSSLLHALTIRWVLAAVFGLASIATAQPYYPLTAKVNPSDASPNDWYGYRIAVSGERILVGAWTDDDLGISAGSAYVWHKVAGVWTEQAELHPADSEQGDFIGSSVALLNDVAVIGSDGDDDMGVNAGAVYVFRYDGKSWIEEAKLLASDGQPNQSFGGSVAISGKTIIASSQFDDDNGTFSGSVYIFRYNGTSWVQEAKLIPSDSHPGQFFGFSVGISGSVAVIGAIGDWTTLRGSAYIFRFNGSAWVQEQELIPADFSFSDKVGSAVAAFGDLVIVSDDLDDELGSKAGAAYIFRYDGNSWVEETKLLASDGNANDRFGWRRAVSISSTHAMVGAIGADGNAVDTGAAYVYRWTGSQWIEDAKLFAPDGAPGDNFGRSVGFHNSIFAVGNPTDSTDAGSNTGSAYVYEISDTCFADFNGDGIVDFLDVQDLHAAFLIGDFSADMNLDGQLDFSDILLFLDAFSQGC